MSDLQTLTDTWGAPEPPSPSAHARARAELVAHVTASRGDHRRRRALPPLRWRLGVRLAVVGAAAVTIAAGLAGLEIVGGLGSDGPTSGVTGLGVPAASAAEVLERAAVASEAKPFTPPRDDQWIFTEERITRSGSAPQTWTSWRRADGGGMAWLDESGTLRFRPFAPPERKRDRARPAFGPLSSYATIAALPTDPDALRRWAYEQATHITNGPDSTDDGEVYLLFNGILRENVLPPDLEAGIFRAMKQIPGATVGTVDVFGSPALAIGLSTASWLHEELLLDPESYGYRGERSTVTRDTTIDPLKAGNATGEVKKGSRVVAERLVTAIVDAAGQRP